MIISPPVTSVSLLARSIRFLAFMASIVGTRPTFPTTEVSVISASLWHDISLSESSPAITSVSVSARADLRSAYFVLSQMQTVWGLNFLACISSNPTLELAESATMLIPPSAEATSRACVPIEPVEPKTAMFFICQTPMQ